MGKSKVIRNPLKAFKKRRNVGKPKVCVITVNNKDDNQASEPNLSSTPAHSSQSGKENTSQKKLGSISENYECFMGESDVNEIFDMSVLKGIFSNCVRCIHCSEVGLELSIIKHVGLASEIELKCDKCSYVTTFWNSVALTPTEENGSKIYEHNIRFVYSLRSIGKGATAGAVFCGIMNLPNPPTKFTTYNKLIGSKVEDVCIESMKNAVEEAVMENNGNGDLTAAFDGTWHKRGHTSLHGVVSATSMYTGKVLDVAVISKYCRCPQKYKGTHENNCTANYSGSSGGMEVAGVASIFQRSEACDKVRYVNYLGDGDSKSFKHVQGLKPYGDDVVVQKFECIGHVQKRMGTRLRRLKASYKKQKLSDGKGLDGKGRLTDSVIDKIQNYYGMAIRQNTQSVDEMKKAVWALFFHTSSTDENPQHSLCPKEEDSWCKYNKGLLTGEVYTHKHSLPDAIRDLAAPELLKKCVHGKTQNPNESVNSVIWSRIPKTVFVGIETLHFGVYDAVATFNDGNIVRCKVFRNMGMKIGFNMVRAMLALDKERLRAADRAVKSLEIQARVNRRRNKRKLEEEFAEDEDNPSYGPGMH